MATFGGEPFAGDGHTHEYGPWEYLGWGRRRVCVRCGLRHAEANGGGEYWDEPSSWPAPPEPRRDDTGWT